MLCGTRLLGLTIDELYKVAPCILDGCKGVILLLKQVDKLLHAQLEFHRATVLVEFSSIQSAPLKSFITFLFFRQFLFNLLCFLEDWQVAKI